MLPPWPDRLMFATHLRLRHTLALDPSRPEAESSRQDRRGIRSFHIDTPERIGPGNRIEHKPLDGDLEVVEPFLPEGPIRVGITSGASTPDRVVEDMLQGWIAAHGDTQVYIRADGGADYATVVAGMAALQQGGVSNLGLITEAPQ